MRTLDDIRIAAEMLRAGKLVAFPTETVYGLGANALDAEAVRKIYWAKGRPVTSPIIVHVTGVRMARSLTTAWPETADVLADRFWPGPLTLVLPKRSVVPDEVTAGLPTVGLRVPFHKTALALLREAKIPIAAPSANRFTQLSPTTADHVRAALGDAVDFVLDGGSCEVGIESTVLSLVGVPTLLRPGMVSKQSIEQLIGKVEKARPAGKGAHASPGMHEQHYQPRTPLLLGKPGDGYGVYLWWNEPLSAGRTVHMPADAIAYGACLYGTLHALDAEGFEWIAVEPVPDTAEWDGIRDRLYRAARKK